MNKNIKIFMLCLISFMLVYVMYAGGKHKDIFTAHALIKESAHYDTSATIDAGFWEVVETGVGVVGLISSSTFTIYVNIDGYYPGYGWVDNLKRDTLQTSATVKAKGFVIRDRYTNNIPGTNIFRIRNTVGILSTGDSSTATSYSQTVWFRD